MTGPGEGDDAGDTGEHARAGREATGWMIRLQDDPEDAVAKAGFDAWLKASVANAAAWEATQRLSQVIVASSARGLASAGRTVDAGPPVRRSLRRRWGARRSLRRRILEVSGMATAACLALVAAPDILLHVRADAVASTGETKQLQLADGSVINLAPGAAFVSDFADGRRQVSLLRGTAYFDVAHDAAHPFIVEAGETTTTVLGTAFEVHREDAGAAVAVRRGRVRVACAAGAQSELLSAGQAVDLECGLQARRSVLDPSRVAAWTDGQLVAGDKPMREVVDAIRPWYRGVIVTRGSGIDRLRVTGVYNLRNPRQALGAVAAAHNASVSTITPWITVISVD